MKKFLLSLVAVLGLSFGVQAAETEDLDLSGMYVWSDGSISDGVVTFTKGWTGVAIWLGETDWSNYSKVTVEVSNVTDMTAIQLYVEYNDGVEKSTKLVNVSDGVATATVELDKVGKASMKQIAIQPNAAGSLKVDRIYLTEAVEYAEGVNLTYDEYGNISASQFDGYSDDAKVVFTYNTTGTLTTGSGEDEVSVVGWGTGSISSWLAAEGADPRSVAVCDVPIKALGDNTLSLTIAELKEALAFEGEWGKGIYWNMYSQGNSTSTRVSAVIYEVKDTSTPVVNINSEVEIVATEYYSVSGVVSVTPQKGINIVKETLSDGSIRTRKLIVK